MSKNQLSISTTGTGTVANATHAESSYLSYRVDPKVEYVNMLMYRICESQPITQRPVDIDVLACFTSSLLETVVRLKTFGTSKPDSTHQMAR